MAFVILVSVIGPFLLSYGPFEQGPNSLQQPGSDHLMGTDEVGRDLLARVLAGTRVDLIITLVAVPVAAVIGTLLGLVAVVSRVADAVVQRMFDVLIGVPAVILGIGVAIAIAPGMESVMIAIALVTMPIFGRQARGALLGQLSLDYVAAAEVLGYPRRRIMMRHILPNIVDVIFVRFAVEMAHAIMIEGGLSVVGLGIQSPQPSLGSMIKDGSSYLFETPLYALAPIFVVLLLVVGYFMVSDALNQAVLRT
ncbi:ABC transporter permease [Actinobacteria bacterium YIM 96077]|uniref:ABC transporter permease n=1 Tax=Phytoactinopolyspora halophila TaxID=1981511 RepID=A0A329QHK0_9ACTN|nr:ABC transporter permease [Actinobacteria bacterium YIM 96077]RAW09838.1 ABC transporter permease [Phytoactinopolyspora halophila]